MKKFAIALACILSATFAPHAAAEAVTPDKLARFHQALRQVRLDYDLVRFPALAEQIDQGSSEEDDLTQSPYVFPLSISLDKLGGRLKEMREEYYDVARDRELGVPISLGRTRTPRHLRIMEDDVQLRSRVSQNGWFVVVGAGEERTPFLIDELYRYNIENETYQFVSTRAGYQSGRRGKR